MKDKRRKIRKILFPAGGILLFFIVFVVCFFLWIEHRIHGIPHDSEREKDISALAGADYSGVFLSMFAPDIFDGDAFGYYRAIPTIQAGHTFQNLADIGQYLEQCFLRKEELSLVYMGIDPYAVSSLYGNHASLYAGDYARYLTGQIQAHPDTVFEFLLPFPALSYLRSVSDQKYDEIVESYRNFVNIMLPYDNARIYFLGYEEWLIANPGNYDDGGQCTEDIARTVLLKTFQNDHYLLRADNMEERLGHMTKLVRDPSAALPDLSQWCAVFFGDSIFDYVYNSTSIPNVVGSLTGAQVYNCAKGGTPAATDPAAPDGQLSFPEMTERFIKGDTTGLEEDNDFFRGLQKYLSDDHSGKRCCFVINFGLNDYFSGLPAENEADPENRGTYAGALRAGIGMLQAHYPDAVIILMGPTYTLEFSEGTQPRGEQGRVLLDYVETAEKAAEETGVCFINGYKEFGINKENQEQYLADGSHPNETGRFYIGNQIIRYMEKIK